MRVARRGDLHVVRLDAGERIVESLRGLARSEGLAGASLAGIGSCRDPELGYFDAARGAYLFRTFAGDFEIAALLGTIGAQGEDGSPAVHAHVVLGGPGFEALAGHLREAAVAATCEIVLMPLDGPLPRKREPGSGLNLLDL